MKTNKFTAVSAALLMIVPAIMLMVPFTVSATSYITTTGVATAGDWKTAYMNNGLLNLSAKDTIDGYWKISSLDGLGQWREVAEYISFNASHGFKTGDTLGYTMGSFTAFSDSLGTGQDFALTMGSSANKVNATFHWRMYDGKSFLVAWVVVTNTAGHVLTLDSFELKSTNAINAYSRLLVGTDVADMWRWSPGNPATWIGSGANKWSTNENGLYTPAFMFASSSSVKSLVIGQIEEKVGGIYIYTTSDGNDNGDGLSGVDVNVDSDQLVGPVEIIAAGNTWTSDKLFVGFSNTPQINEAFADYNSAVLAFNSFYTEYHPFGGGVIYNTWNSYPRNITHGKVEAIANFTVAYGLPIDWIHIDYGWSDKVNTINEGDTLAMEVNTTKFPDMAATIAYIHSLGFKASIWISPCMMMYNGEMNNTHPEWRLALAAGGYAHSTFGSSKYWIADMSNPDYLSYLTTQLALMESTWSIDGIMLDFVTYPDVTYLPNNALISEAHIQHEFLSAVNNGTNDTYDEVQFGGTVRNNMMLSQAFNTVQGVPDADGTWATFRDGIQNYTSQYLIQTSSLGDNVMLPTLGISSTFYYATVYPQSLTTAMTSIQLAYGIPAEVGFVATYVGHEAYFTTISALSAQNDVTGLRYIGGENAVDRTGCANLAYFGRSGGDYATYRYGLYTVAVIAWEPGTNTYEASLVDMGMNVGAAYVWDSATNLVTSETSLSYSLAYHVSDLFVLKGYGPMLPAAIIPFVELILFFLTLGIVLIPVMMVVKLTKEKRVIRVDEVVRMVVTIVVGLALVGTIYLII